LHFLWYREYGETTVITERTIEIAKQTAKDLRRRGKPESAQAIEDLVEAASPGALPTLDLLTTTQAGDLIGVSGQTIKNWAHAGRFAALRVGGRIMVPREAVETYVRRARESLALEEISDADAARLVSEARARP